jgi:hypothetical protein
MDNNIVILTGVDDECITYVDWSSFGDFTDPDVLRQVECRSSRFSTDVPMYIQTSRYLPV